jgi:lipopolysaccharide-binding protein
VDVVLSIIRLIALLPLMPLGRPHISDSGSCDVSVSSVSLSVSVVVGADSSGHPTVKASGCSLDIGHLDITFHGGARCIIIIIEIGTKGLTSFFSFSWLYNLFSDNIAGSLKGSLSDQVSMCTIMYMFM